MRTESGANLAVGGILLAAGLKSLFFVLFRSEDLPLYHGSFAAVR
jgi:hypothetical protein